jgi:hypothetical protein
LKCGDCGGKDRQGEVPEADLVVNVKKLRQEWSVRCELRRGVWRVACDVWRVACGGWRVACGVRHLGFGCAHFRTQLQREQIVFYRSFVPILTNSHVSHTTQLNWREFLHVT